MPLKKNTSLNHKDTRLITLFKEHFSGYFRRIQRFFAEVNLPMELAEKLIFGLLPNKKSLTLVMDRTNWKLGQTNINVLMLGVSYKNVAFALILKLLDNKDYSNTNERIELINDFIKWFTHTLYLNFGFRDVLRSWKRLYRLFIS